MNSIIPNSHDEYETDSQHHEDDLGSFFERLSKLIADDRAQGKLFRDDERLLKLYAANPLATYADMGKKLGWNAQSVVNRLSSDRLKKYRDLIEGTAAEKMGGGMDLYARWLHETMVIANTPIDAVIEQMARDIPDEKRRAIAERQLMKRIDPFNIVRLGSSLMNWATEQAKAQAAENAHVGHKEGAQPLQSTPEALAILEADAITAEATPTLDVKPIGE